MIGAVRRVVAFGLPGSLVTGKTNASTVVDWFGVNLLVRYPKLYQIQQIFQKFPVTSGK
jgi:hypothetical protein